MITIFDDRIQRNGHELFQEWRKVNPSGFFLNLSPFGVLLHDSQCLHLRNPDFESRQQGEYSHTKKPKVCARTVEELKAWAEKEGRKIRECLDCRPDARSPLVLTRTKYEEELNHILLKSQSELLAEEFEGILPARVKVEVYRILRDTRLALKVKQLHRYRCQVCGSCIVLSDGSLYAEAHHIRPLGKPHNGPDSLSNLVCLCPNHHVEMDYRVSQLITKQLRVAKGHAIQEKHVRYHNALVKKAAMA